MFHQFVMRKVDNHGSWKLLNICSGLRKKPQFKKVENAIYFKVFCIWNVFKKS